MINRLIFFLIFFIPFQFIAAKDLPLDRLNLPAGYAISVYAEVPKARAITTIEDHVFVSTKDGSIYHIDSEGIPTVIVKGLGLSFGIAHQNEDLFFTNRGSVFVVRSILEKLAAGKVIEPEIFLDKLPDHGMPYHAGKYLRIFENSMFISIGRPGDIMDADPENYGKIIRVDMKTKKVENYATGLRNSVGFDVNPITKNLWFTDNGPDRLGEELPKEEVNEVTHPGQFFGFPYTHGGTVISKNPQKHSPVEPALLMPAHIAPLGMLFYDGQMFPDLANRVLLIAEHGSWARKNPLGYRISMFRFQTNGTPSPDKKYEVFIDGWFDTHVRKAWGRPVDITQDSKGRILITDDHAGVVYCLYRK